MLFSQDHEYVVVDGDVATVGISDHAQHQLGDIVFVELPEVGRKLDKGEAAAVVESVKAASDVFTPVGGEVIEINEPIVNQTAIINEDAQGAGWLFKVRLANASDLDGLMNTEAYAAYLKSVV